MKNGWKVKLKNKLRNGWKTRARTIRGMIGKQEQAQVEEWLGIRGKSLKRLGVKAE